MSDAVCRLCLRDVDPDDSGSSVLDAAFQKALAAVFRFKIKFNEDLPEYTCKQCSWNVLDFHSYSEIVKNNQEKLLQDTSQTNRSNNTFTEDSFEGFEDQGIEENGLEKSSSMKTVEENGHIVSDKKRDLDHSEMTSEYLMDCETTTSLVNGAADKLCSVLVCEEFIISNLNNENDSSNSDTVETPFERDILTADDRLISAGDDNEEREIHDANAKRKRVNSPKDKDTASATNGLKLHQEPSAGKTDESYACEDCGKTFETKWQTEYHSQKHHTTVKCPCCNKSILAKDLNSHILTHQRDFRCSLCKNNFLSKYAYRKHICESV
uniref:C2H2-type domain-containing protein n=1 Tax=Anopheles gambiae TaxID=7165 RepID=A0A1S4H1R3_ANOGA